MVGYGQTDKEIIYLEKSWNKGTGRKGMLKSFASRLVAAML